MRTSLRIINPFSYSVDLLHPMLVVGSLPLQLLAALPRLFQLGLVQVAAATSSRQVLLQLSDGDPHLLQLGMIFLHKDHRKPQDKRGEEWGGRGAERRYPHPHKRSINISKGNFQNDESKFHLIEHKPQPNSSWKRRPSFPNVGTCKHFIQLLWIYLSVSAIKVALLPAHQI